MVGVGVMCLDMENTYVKRVMQVRLLDCLVSLPCGLGSRASVLYPHPQPSPFASCLLHAGYCLIIEYEIVSFHLDAIGNDAWITA